MLHTLTASPAARPRHRRLTTLAIAAVSALVATTISVPAAVAADSPGLVTNPAQYVNTLAGTGSGGSVVGSINNFPGATAPFGMIQFTPTNPGRGQGYYYDNDNLRGFALNSASQGCGAFGDFPILPSTLSVASGQQPWTKTNSYSHDGEVGKVADYELTSTDGNGVDIDSRLTATTRTGVAEFRFPAGTTAPKVFLRAGVNNAGSGPGSLNINPTTGNVTGWAKSGHFCGKNNSYQAYFAASFEYGDASGTTSTDGFGSYGVWNESSGAITAGNGTSDAEVTANNPVGGYVQFPDGTTVVRMRVALSYVDTDNAIENMETEVPTLDSSTFGAVKQQTTEAWNDKLSTIQLAEPAAGNDAALDDVKTFYSLLYRSLLHPNTFDDVNGEYIGFEGNADGSVKPQVHNVDEVPAADPERTRVQYANFSDWDTYRTLAPLQALLFPTEASDMVQSLVNDADQAGSLPRWAFLNASTNQMSGDNASALISQMFAYGARDFDTTGALDHMVAGAIGPKAGEYTGGTNNEAITRPAAKLYSQLGYAPQIKAYQTDHSVTGASITEEFSIDDFAIGQMAAALGQDDTASLFQERSNYWQNLFNPTTRCISPRDSNGKFPEGDNCNIIPTDFGYRGHITGYGEVGYDEGNAEQYLWLVPQNVAGLVSAIGGREAAAIRLNKFMTHGLNVGPGSYESGTGAPRSLQPYMNSGNEPNFQTPWLYNYIGYPWKTTEVVDQMRTTLFGHEPNGSEPGNDDLGAQASWFVWAALGLFPTTPGTDVLTVNAPMTDHAVVHLGNGHTLTVDADGALAGKRYIEGLSVNGTPTSKTYLPDGTLAQDSTVTFDLGDTPSTTWGTAISDAPPSFGTGSHAIVANVAQSELDVAPGDDSELTVDMQQITATASTFTVTADSASGITIGDPGTLDVSATGGGSATLPVSVSTSTPAGYYAIPVTVTNGDATASTTATIKVSEPDTLFAARNLVGTAPASDPTGNFDGAGNTYQRESLASVGLTPGAVRTLDDGTAFVWPSSPVGTPDTVAPNGQTINLDRPTSVIAFIGAGTNNGGENTATVRYDDGTTGTADFSFSDWVLPSSDGDKNDGTLAPKFGNRVVAWTPVRNATSSNPGAYVFATKATTAPAGKKIISVTLPTTTDARLFTIAQDAPTLTAAPTTVDAGKPLAFQGTGYGANEDVTVTAGTGHATVTSSDQGAISGTIVVPADTRGGALTVTASSATVPFSPTASVTVIGGTQGPGGPGTPGKTATHPRLTVSPTKAVSGTDVRLTVSLPGDATGGVTFYDGTTPVAVASASHGSATASVGGLAVGTHQLKATYSGDTAYESGTSAAVTVKVVKAALKKLKVKAKKRFRAHHKVTVKVKASKKLTNGHKAKGKVTVKVGKKTVKKMSLKKLRKHHGKVVIKKRFVKGKKLKVKVTFTPKSTKTTKKATAKVTLKRKR